MAAHLRPFAPNSTDVDRNLIASPSPTHVISSDDVVMCRRVAPVESALVEMFVRCDEWMARLVLRAIGVGRGVFMASIINFQDVPVHVQKTEIRTNE